MKRAETSKTELWIIGSEESVTATGDVSVTLTVCVCIWVVIVVTHVYVALDTDIDTYAFLRAWCYQIFPTKNNCCSLSGHSVLPCTVDKNSF